MDTKVCIENLPSVKLFIAGDFHGVKDVRVAPSSQSGYSRSSGKGTVRDSTGNQCRGWSCEGSLCNLALHATVSAGSTLSSIATPNQGESKRAGGNPLCRPRKNPR